jgi:hypothetical protein
MMHLKLDQWTTIDTQILGLMGFAGDQDRRSNPVKIWLDLNLLDWSTDDWTKILARVFKDFSLDGNTATVLIQHDGFIKNPQGLLDSLSNQVTRAFWAYVNEHRGWEEEDDEDDTCPSCGHSYGEHDLGGICPGESNEVPEYHEVRYTKGPCGHHYFE